ncbi:MAG: hypothetical protein P8188_00275 [Gemmatimonadota bacterium]
MLDAELIELLVCPDTKQSLRVADDDLLARLNAAMADGRVRNRGGSSVSTPLSAALVRQDGRLLYPVRDDIPIMLLDESIDLSELS